MTAPAAFRATYSDFKLVKTRQVVQIILEVPLEQSSAVLDVLGGMPDVSKESWVAVARLSAEAAQPRQIESTSTAGASPSRNWRDLQPAQQAGIRCGEPMFAAFLREQHPDDWHESADDAASCVRLICGVHSRVELGTKQKARVIWTHLDGEYQGWLARERVGA